MVLRTSESVGRLFGGSKGIRPRDKLSWAVVGFGDVLDSNNRPDLTKLRKHMARSGEEMRKTAGALLSYRILITTKALRV